MSSNSDTELLSEHFGYPPVSLIDDIINSVNILAERALNSVEKGLLTQPPAALGFKPSKQQQQQQKQQQESNNNTEKPDPAEEARDEIESGTHQLETLLCASIDRNFDKFEIYVLRNILCVRPPRVRDWIRLSHYEGLDFSTITSTTTTTITNPTTTTAGGGENGENGQGEGGDSNANGNANANADAVTTAEAGTITATSTNPDLPTLEGITKLRRKLRESMRLNALLTAERARNERLLEDLRRVVGAPSSATTNPAAAIKNEPFGGGSSSISSSSVPPEAAATTDSNNKNKNNSPFAFLHKKGDLAEAGPDTPLSTTTAFTLSQMEALRALSTSLRTMAPDLATSTSTTTTTTTTKRHQSRRSRSRSRSRSRQLSSTGNDESEDEEGEDREDGEDRKTKKKKNKKSWRRERLEYVEGATRRHLETVQGLELGRDGEVRDGEWQGEGRTLAMGEVEGLEKVVSLLGGEGSGTGTGSGGGGGGNGGGSGKTKGAGGDAAVEQEEEEEEGEGEDADADADADRMDES